MGLGISFDSSFAVTTLKLPFGSVFDVVSSIVPKRNDRYLCLLFVVVVVMFKPATLLKQYSNCQ